MAQDKKEINFKVAEAQHRDAGRGIARIDTKYMEELGLVSGDIIEIKGKKPVPAIVWPGYPEDRDKKIIRIDGIIRSNALIGIDEAVKISKAVVKPAKSITLQPSQTIGVLETGYLRRLFEGKPLIEGQKIRIETFEKPFNFTVTKTDPSGIILVSGETEFSLKKAVEEVTRKTQITYEDIGGLKREVGLIREMIELPLRQPELFEKLGITPPKGVLLLGPPGTGKTLLAKAVANETDANFITINGPEIISKWYGESEKALRDIFEEASANPPCIIFIDEIDSIAPKRSEMTGERQIERRVVSQLLTLMDGLKSRGEVIVIAATNEPNIIDPALRRGGRFDREIEIGVPDTEGRLEILHVHTRGMPLTDDVDLKKIAEITHGFVGADLAALSKEAAMHQIRILCSKFGYGFKVDGETKEIPSEVIENLKVNMDDFYEALKNVQPSAMREVFIDVPNVKWGDVGGLENAKQELKEAVEWPLKYPKLFEYSKTKPAKGILLAGSPGTGKTLLAKALANESGVNFISVKGPELISKFVGESEKGVREAFRKAKQASPCIIFFDEIDAIAPTRGEEIGTKVTERVVSQLLTELDGLVELKGVVVLAATNRKDLIDPALLRPGRFDRIITLSNPDENTRLEIFKIHIKGKPLDKDVDLKSLTKSTEGFSGADLAAVCQEASIIATREFVKKMGEKTEEDVKKFKITESHFKKSLEDIKLKKKEG